MIRTALFGRSGLTWAELHPLHRLARLAHTFINVKLSGESWETYREEWVDPRNTWRSALRPRR